MKRGFGIRLVKANQDFHVTSLFEMDENEKKFLRAGVDEENVGLQRKVLKLLYIIQMNPKITAE